MAQDRTTCKSWQLSKCWRSSAKLCGSVLPLLHLMAPNPWQASYSSMSADKAMQTYCCQFCWCFHCTTHLPVACCTLLTHQSKQHSCCLLQRQMLYAPPTSMPGFQLIPGWATRRIRANASPPCCPTTPNLATLPPPARSGLSPPAQTAHAWPLHLFNTWPTTAPS